MHQICMRIAACSTHQKPHPTPAGKLWCVSGPAIRTKIVCVPLLAVCTKEPSCALAGQCAPWLWYVLGPAVCTKFVCVSQPPICTKTARRTLVSQDALQLKGIPPDRYLGMHLDLVHIGPSSAHWNLLWILAFSCWCVLSGNQPLSLTCEIMCKSGCP